LKILSLSGEANIRIWTTAYPTTNDVPLLVTGQTVTNGIDGVRFGEYPAHMLYVETLDSGTATLYYSYVGTGEAEGYECSASLNVCAVEVNLEINDTLEQDDDIVIRYSTNPAGRPTIPCRARVLGLGS